MILKKLILGALGTNCYIFGSNISNEVVIIDPGGEASQVIKTIETLNAKPIAIVITHGHFDHTMRVGKLMRYYKIHFL